MKALLFSMMISLLGAVTACNGGGGGSTPTPAVPPANLNSANVLCTSPTAAPINLAAFTTAVSQNYGSYDVVQGRIVNRQFHLAIGGGEEHGVDSCLSSDTGNSIDDGFRIGRPNEDIVFNFDAQGILTILIVNKSGQMISNSIYPDIGNGQRPSGPAYRLNDSTQTLEIDPFIMQGAPSYQYVNMERNRAGISRRSELRQLDDKFNVHTNYYGSRAIGPLDGQMGFRSDYQAGQPVGYGPMYNTNSGNPAIPTANGSCSAVGGTISATFDNGLVARIFSQAPNWQHIIKLEVGDLYGDLKYGDLNYVSHSVVYGNTNYSGNNASACTADLKNSIQFRLL